eukprot:jgi/Chlat1/7942/Chrsp68S07378
MASRRAAAAAAAAGRALRSRHGAGLGVSPLYRQLIRVEGSSNASWQELLGTSSVSPFSTASPFLLHSSGLKGSGSLLPHLVRHASGGPAAAAQNISVRGPHEVPLPLPITLPDANNKDKSKDKGSGSRPDGAKLYKVDFSSPEACDDAVDSLLAARNKALDGFKARYGERLWLGRFRQVAQLATNILLAVPRFLLKIPGWLKTLSTMSRSDWAQSWQKLKAGAKREAQHYWAGTKLLGWDIRIASELSFKASNELVLRGKQLTRREKRQLTRTVADVFRLVPMVVILVIPFMELALPFLLRLFPNMLPSTYQDSMKAEENLRKKVVVKLEMAKFLQDTLEEMAKDIKQNRTGELSSTAAEFTSFMNKVRTGSAVSNDEIIKFSKLFNDELTLDNLSRPQLVSMCKYMGVPSIGSDAFLRYQLRAKLQWIKRDDRMIQHEGIDSLNAEELRAACRTRGMRWSAVSTEQMEKQLADWLDLSLNRALPSSLLIMSRAFTIGNVRVTPDEAMHALQETLSSMPDEVLKDVGMEVLASQATPERRLEYLRRQREKIELEEEEALKQEQAEAVEALPLPELEAAAAAERTKDEELLSPQERASREAVKKEEKIRDISRALAVLAASSSVAREREDFIELVEKEIEYYNRRQVEDGEHDTSSALLERVNGMLHNIEKELDNVDSRIGDKLHVLDRDKDGKITPDELAAAITTLRDSLHHEELADLIEQLDQDIDGKISIENILELADEEDEDKEDDKDNKKKESPELLQDETVAIPAVEAPSRQQAKA